MNSLKNSSISVMVLALVAGCGSAAETKTETPPVKLAEVRDRVAKFKRRLKNAEATDAR